MDTIQNKWHSMTPEERVAYAGERVEAIKEKRLMQDTSSHQAPLNAFNDTRATLTLLENEVRVLVKSSR